MFSGIPLFPEQASTLAPRVDNLYLFIVAVTAFFALLVTVVVIVFAVKYRTDDPLAVGARIHGSIPLELAWSIVPFIISIVIFGWAADVFFDLQRPPEDQRIAVVLCDVYGMDYGEVANATESALGTVKSRIHRGRLRLRDLMAAHRELFLSEGRLDR